MKKRKSADLVKRLVDNRISRKELDEFLDGLDDEESAHAYEARLKIHFENIIEEHTTKAEKQKNKEPSK